MPSLECLTSEWLNNLAVNSHCTVNEIINLLQSL